MADSFFSTFDEAERVPPDPCRRAGDNPESADAYAKVSHRTAVDRVVIFGLIKYRGLDGATIHELCEALSKQRGRPHTPNQISGRLTELHEKGHIYRYGRRNGAAIWRAR